MYGRALKGRANMLPKKGSVAAKLFDVTIHIDMPIRHFATPL